MKKKTLCPHTCAEYEVFFNLLQPRPDVDPCGKDLGPRPQGCARKGEGPTRSTRPGLGPSPTWQRVEP